VKAGEHMVARHSQLCGICFIVTGSTPVSFQFLFNQSLTTPHLAFLEFKVISNQPHSPFVGFHVCQLPVSILILPQQSMTPPPEQQVQEAAMMMVTARQGRSGRHWKMHP
jgi:hypothetical protein